MYRRVVPNNTVIITKYYTRSNIKFMVCLGACISTFRIKFQTLRVQQSANQTSRDILNIRPAQPASKRIDRYRYCTRDVPVSTVPVEWWNYWERQLASHFALRSENLGSVVIHHLAPLLLLACRSSKDHLFHSSSETACNCRVCSKFDFAGSKAKSSHGSRPIIITLGRRNGFKFFVI